MRLAGLGLANPTAVAVVVLLVVLFGVVGFSRLPIQLVPEVELPEITITTQWRSAAAEEVESEIVKPQEDALRGLQGMTELVAQAQQGRAEINLKFSAGTQLTQVLVEVLSRLNQVADYPPDAGEPFISSSGSDARPIAWFILQPLPGNNLDVAGYRDYVEEVVKTRIERVPGVSRSEIYGGRVREIRVTFDPYRLADAGIDIPIIARFAGSFEDVSGGFIDVGRREYSLRFQGRYALDEIGGMILTWRDGRPVHLRDVAQVAVELADQRDFVLSQGLESIAVNARREIGVNVLQVMDGLGEAVEELREGWLKRSGLNIKQVYDETVYIDSAMRLLFSNLGLGILLAVGMLWIFLRRLRATFVVLLSIPACLAFTFMTLFMDGRTLNVISLAGLAFAVGLVLDASIVVLENIVRLRESGTGADGAEPLGQRAVSQVWGALLASTATTVAVFLPIIFLESEAGQLFADLALTLSAAIVASLLVAVYVVPAAESRWLGPRAVAGGSGVGWDRITAVIMALTAGRARRAVGIGVLLTLPVLSCWLLFPKLDYLPTGNRNLVFAFVLPAPGSNVEFLADEMGGEVAARMRPHMVGAGDDRTRPWLKHYFYVGVRGQVFMGAVAEDSKEIPEALDLVNGLLWSFPDTLAFARQASLFGGLSSGSTIELDLQGRGLEELYAAAPIAYQHIQEALPGAQVRPLPGLVLARPELRLLPDERRIAEAGWDRGTLANIVRALGDGYYAGEYFDGEDTLDIMVRSAPWAVPENLVDVPLVTPAAGTVRLGDLARLSRTAASEQIRRVNQRRTITLQITPPPGVSLDEALGVLKEEVEPQLWGHLPADGAIHYRGTAEKLSVAIRELGGSFLLAAAILYLLMSALLRSFGYSLLVFCTLPLATVGGVLALRLFGLPLDLLTMMGFVILLGLVMNNAILLVYQAREGEREGLARRAAVQRAVRIRLRPIMMSTMTSIFGMLPLMLVPGDGSELYRGLASVIVGGMAVSLVFSLILLPALLRVGEEARAA